MTTSPIGSCVDLVLCALAIEYVDDRVSALRELRRVLRPGGALVLSRQHPTGDWLAPLETTCEEIAAARFLIERLLEPRPVPEAAAIDPAEYERPSAGPRSQERTPQRQKRSRLVSDSAGAGSRLAA